MLRESKQSTGKTGPGETANSLILAEHMAVFRITLESLSWLNLVHCFPSLFPSSFALPLTSAGYSGVWGEVGFAFCSDE